MPRLAVEADAVLRVDGGGRVRPPTPRAPAPPRCRAAGRGWRASRPRRPESRARAHASGRSRTRRPPPRAARRPRWWSGGTRPRGSGLTVESAAASMVSASARQVRGGVSVRSSKRIAPSVSAKRSRVNGGRRARLGRAATDPRCSARRDPSARCARGDCRARRSSIRGGRAAACRGGSGLRGGRAVRAVGRARGRRAEARDAQVAAAQVEIELPPSSAGGRSGPRPARRAPSGPGSAARARARVAATRTWRAGRPRR